MIYMDLIFNLSFLVALSVVSGFIDERWPQRSRIGALLQGTLFGSASVIGMLHPVFFAPGVIFDGRSVMISLGALFFGLWAAVLSSVMTIACRIWLGGDGTITGILVILASALTGLLVRTRWKSHAHPPTARQLYGFGLVVHIIMLALMFTLPASSRSTVLQAISLPVLGLYPLATVLVGKILANQQASIQYRADLQATNKNLDITLRSIGDAVIATDLDGKISRMNPAAERLTGWREAEALGQPLALVLPLLQEDTRLPLPDSRQRLLQTGESPEFTNHTLLIDRQGNERCIAEMVTPICDDNGAQKGMVLVLHDQTQDRKAAAALERQVAETEANRRLLQMIYDSANIGICQVDQAGHFVNVNHAFTELTGYARTELLGHPFIMILPATDLAHAIHLHDRFLRENNPVKATDIFWKVQRKDGTLIDVEITEAQLTLPDGNRSIVTTVTDITQQKKSEEALRQSLAFVKFIQQIANRLISLDIQVFDQTIEGMLQEVCTLFDLERGYVFLCDDTCDTARLSHEWCAPGIFPHRGFLDQIALREFEDFVATLRRDEPVQINTCQVEPTATNRFVLDILHQHSIKSFINLPLKVEDTLLGWIGFDVIQTERAWTQDSIEAFILTGQLITSAIQRKQAEETRHELEAHLRQSQKLEAIGQLAGGIAHDFNNILVPISGYAELALLELTPDSKIYTDLTQIRAAAERATHLTRQILAFGRKQALEIQLLDFNQVIRDLQPFMDRVIREDIAVHIRLAPVLDLVQADRSQLEQVVLNLIINACDAMPTGGELLIETSNILLDKLYATRHVGVQPGQYVLLMVSDTGYGMDADTLQHIFEPFFTTKARGKGTGLGLATVYGIVKQHGGNIWVYSEPGQGTIFKIYVPRAADQALSIAPPILEDTAPMRGTETLLVVEDEALVRQLVCETLATYGYTVLEAAHPEAALALVTSYHNTIHLMLTDLIMPGMSGRDLYQRAVVIRPDMKVLYMSGYTDDIIIRHGMLEEGVHLLQKPFTLHTLMHQIQRVLGG